MMHSDYEKENNDIEYIFLFNKSKRQTAHEFYWQKSETDFLQNVYSYSRMARSMELDI